MSIAENVAACRDRINAAAAKAGRDPKEIIFVAATKMNDASRVREAVEAGIDVCGENRVQEMLEKNSLGAYEGCPLHFIGHLQKNKVKQVVGLASLIHSADSLELLAAIDRAAAAKGIVQDVLLEINIGAEESKSGFTPDAAKAAALNCGAFASVRVRGLMAIPPACAFPEENRPFFDEMRQLFIDISKKKADNVFMDFLSMGMSGDFETAIACGANMVRIGTGVFGPRDYGQPKSK